MASTITQTMKYKTKCVLFSLWIIRSAITYTIRYEYDTIVCI